MPRLPARPSSARELSFTSSSKRNLTPPRHRPAGLSWTPPPRSTHRRRGSIHFRWVVPDSAVDASQPTEEAMHRKTLVALAFAASAAVASSTFAADAPKWKKIKLSDQFHCEGAHFADFNKDG